MRTPKEWEIIIFNNPTMTVKELVSQVQTESYNEALTDISKYFPQLRAGKLFLKTAIEKLRK